MESASLSVERKAEMCLASIRITTALSYIASMSAAHPWDPIVVDAVLSSGAVLLMTSSFITAAAEQVLLHCALPPVSARGRLLRLHPRAVGVGHPSALRQQQFPA